jgi:hypothetical protein
MPVRRRTDGAADSWWVRFSVGGKRYQYTVRAKDELEAFKMESVLRASVTAGRVPPKIKRRYEAKWGRLLDNARTRALRRGEQFPLTQRDMEHIIARSRSRCEVTGLPFSWKWHPNQRRRPFAPSLDRIIPALGYTRANVRLVCVAVNIAINEWGEDTFAAIASAYLSHREKYTIQQQSGSGSVSEKVSEAVEL